MFTIPAVTAESASINYFIAKHNYQTEQELGGLDLFSANEFAVYFDPLFRNRSFKNKKIKKFKKKGTIFCN